MDPSIVPILQTVLVLPALAIVAGITARVIKMILGHQEQKTLIQAQSRGAGSESLRDEIQSLREDVARLRDTSTQYDISIQHTLEDLQYRVGALESRRAAVPPAAHSEEPAAVGIKRAG